tara:strand:- start:427 stop:669 length:243 start_codon:yes stop_codon:yes gene_type:complete
MKPNAKIEKQIKKQACEFASSTRGQFIIGKALAVAVETLSKLPKERKPSSDIDDMKYLIDHLFQMGAVCHALENGEGGQS